MSANFLEIDKIGEHMCGATTIFEYIVKWSIKYDFPKSIIVQLSDKQGSVHDRKMGANKDAAAEGRATTNLYDYKVQ